MNSITYKIIVDSIIHILMDRLKLLRNWNIYVINHNTIISYQGQSNLKEKYILQHTQNWTIWLVKLV